MGRCQIGLPGRRDQVGALLSCSWSFFLPFRHKDRERAEAAQCPEGAVAKRRERSEWSLQKRVQGTELAALAMIGCRIGKKT